MRWGGFGLVSFRLVDGMKGNVKTKFGSYMNGNG